MKWCVCLLVSALAVAVQVVDDHVLDMRPYLMVLAVTLAGCLTVADLLIKIVHLSCPNDPTRSKQDAVEGNHRVSQ